MTASDADRTNTVASAPFPAQGNFHLVAEPVSEPVEVIARPLPRLGRGIVWSNIVAEIERDHQERLRMRDAA